MNDSEIQPRPNAAVSNGKRKRDASGTDSGNNKKVQQQPDHYPLPKSNNTNTNKTSNTTISPTKQRSGRHKGTTTTAGPLPLHTIPDRIEDLVYIINLGGCPRCGNTTDCRKKGKKTLAVAAGSKATATAASTSTGSHPIIRKQKYNCKECKKIFHKSDRSTTDEEMGTYADRTYEGKMGLQSLFRQAYGEIAKKETTADAKQFEGRMDSLRYRMSLKRKNVSELLDTPMGDVDYCGNNGSSSSNVERQHYKIIDPSKKVPEAAKEKHPFRATILLLRQETRRLERSMDELLTHHRRYSALEASSLASSSAAMVVEGAAQTKKSPSIARQGISIDEEEQLSSTVDVVTVHPESDDNNNDGYQLGCRIKQDDGEEIEIFEKSIDDDDDDEEDGLYTGIQHGGGTSSRV